MNYRLREFVIAKIRLGNIYVKELDLVIKPAVLSDILSSYDVYNKTFEESVTDGLMTVEENEQYMLRSGQWTNLNEDNLKSVNTLIEDTKVLMYENYNVPKKLKSLKKTLTNKQNLYKSLLSKKNSNYSNTAESFSETARLMFLIKRCSDNKQVDLENNSMAIISAYNASMLDDSTIRDLCRNEPWKSLWSVRNEIKQDLFCNEELTINQKNLILWSKSYEGIHESIDAPPKEVIDDDDCLDGWFIAQNRKRIADRKKAQVEDSIKNQKIKNADNVFIIADSEQQAKDINGVNSPEAQSIKATRDVALKKGPLEHSKLPDRQAHHIKNVKQGLKKG